MNEEVADGLGRAVVTRGLGDPETRRLLASLMNGPRLSDPVMDAAMRLARQEPAALVHRCLQDPEAAGIAIALMPPESAVDLLHGLESVDPGFVDDTLAVPGHLKGSIAAVLEQRTALWRCCRNLEAVLGRDERARILEAARTGAAATRMEGVPL